MVEVEEEAVAEDLVEEVDVEVRIIQFPEILEVNMFPCF